LDWSDKLRRTEQEAGNATYTSVGRFGGAISDVLHVDVPLEFALGMYRLCVSWHVYIRARTMGLRPQPRDVPFIVGATPRRRRGRTRSR